MSTFPWKVSGKGVLRSGVVEAASDRDALQKVLGGALDLGFSPKGDESYSITVGPLTTSAYGDEFDRVAGAHSIDETDLDMSQGHLFNDPVLERLAPDAYLTPKQADAYIDADCGHTVETCKEKFTNQQNFGGWPGAGIQPPNASRPPVQANADRWELEQHADVDFQHYIGRLGGKPVVTQVRRELRASFSGAAAQAVMDAVRNQDEIQIRHDIGDGTPIVVRFIPTSAVHNADGTVSVEGPVTDSRLDP